MNGRYGPMDDLTCPPTFAPSAAQGKTSQP